MALDNLMAIPDYQSHMANVAKDDRLMDFGTLYKKPKHDLRFILPEVLTTYGPPLQLGNELHGHYSQAMIGSTVPGVADPRLRSIGISMASDLKPDHLVRGVNLSRQKEEPQTFLKGTQIPQLGDKSHDPKMLNAMQSLLTTGQQTPAMVDARTLDAFRRGWRGVGRMNPKF